MFNIICSNYSNSRLLRNINQKGFLKSYAFLYRKVFAFKAVIVCRINCLSLILNINLPYRKWKDQNKNQLSNI